MLLPFLNEIPPPKKHGVINCTFASTLCVTVNEPDIVPPLVFSFPFRELVVAYPDKELVVAYPDKELVVAYPDKELVVAYPDKELVVA